MWIKNNTPRKITLLIASYYFYSYWDARFLPLLLVPTFTDFYIGKFIESVHRKSIRKTLVVLSIIVNLGVLGFFKYYNFFIESFSMMMDPLGIELHTINILLPVGISFFTFSTLSYTIDVYRRKISPCESILDYALFIAFFPKLLAGSIARA